jgi:hypothetical protein
MEEIYLQAFRINMLKDHVEINDSFVHISNEEDLSIKLAEELIERDSLKMYLQSPLFARLTIW